MCIPYQQSLLANPAVLCCAGAASGSTPAVMSSDLTHQRTLVQVASRRPRNQSTLSSCKRSVVPASWDPGSRQTVKGPTAIAVYPKDTKKVTASSELR